MPAVIGMWAPEESTVRRLAQHVDGDVLDAAISAWRTARTNNQAGDDLAAGSPPAAVAIDGTSVRGTFTRTGGAGVLLLIGGHPHRQ
ncbi:hypothetical protein [Kibdelosporangium aridum]|uniref:Uncharacterized protein n=1 Tax=Kibdelosporangium aridum TaxID=2030 RepID=A0A1W2FPB5_KIBAR|nr:hypothetical protein [Kibdelosporangium aridum]SMD23448.1 hypothetical protein SAMN05661093_07976 [Kibdelosporangium aridum]